MLFLIHTSCQQIHLSRLKVITWIESWLLKRIKHMNFLNYLYSYNRSSCTDWYPTAVSTQYRLFFYRFTFFTIIVPYNLCVAWNRRIAENLHAVKYYIDKKAFFLTFVWFFFQTVGSQLCFRFFPHLTRTHWWWEPGIPGRERWGWGWHRWEGARGPRRLSGWGSWGRAAGCCSLTPWTARWWWRARASCSVGTWWSRSTCCRRPGFVYTQWVCWCKSDTCSRKGSILFCAIIVIQVFNLHMIPHILNCISHDSE